MPQIKNINCPNCNHEFEIEQALAGKLELVYKEKISKVSDNLKNQYAEKEQALLLQQKEFESLKKKENELFKQRLDQAKIDQETTLRKRLYEEQQAQTNQLKKELEEKRDQVKLLKDKELEMERLKTKLQDQEKDLELKFERDFRQKLQEKEEQISLRVKEQNDLRLKEKDKQLEDQKKLIDEMKRKAEQGSMQSQGEIQELAIEEILRVKFPFDIIEEVPKGVRGADSVQTVINSAQQVCGKIIIESKRTKSFSNDWLSKLKEDQRSIGAEIAVLITEAMPKELSQFGQLENVWVCGYQEFASLISVLRQVLIKTQSIASAQENKGDKMEVLYNFVIGEEFKNQILAIVEGFSALKNDLDKEKRAMQSIWKRREKQIEQVIGNTIDMHASIKGIAGNAIQTIKVLELGDGDGDADNLI